MDTNIMTDEEMIAHMFSKYKGCSIDELSNIISGETYSSTLEAIVINNILQFKLTELAMHAFGHAIIDVEWAEK
jgi:hypothetical protein